MSMEPIKPVVLEKGINLLLKSGAIKLSGIRPEQEVKIIKCKKLKTKKRELP